MARQSAPNSMRKTPNQSRNNGVGWGRPGTKASDWRGTRPAPWASLCRLLPIDKANKRWPPRKAYQVTGPSATPPSINSLAICLPFLLLLLAEFNVQSNDATHRRTTHKLRDTHEHSRHRRKRRIGKRNQKTKATDSAADRRTSATEADCW
jgi:hypothetical protein